MVGRCGRLAVLGVGVALVLGGAVGCGGDSATRTVDVKVQPGESATEWYTRALGEGSKVCTGSKPPERVVFGIKDEDANTEVAAAVERGEIPSSVPCQGFVPQTTASANR